jgi:hypothetical protein
VVKERRQGDYRDNKGDDEGDDDGYEGGAFESFSNTEEQLIIA